jgi:hypothetical protein
MVRVLPGSSQINLSDLDEDNIKAGETEGEDASTLTAADWIRTSPMNIFMTSPPWGDDLIKSTFMHSL